MVLAPPGSGLRILTVAAHAPGEAVFSPARVMGDGELKFKYLNPNTLLVASGLPAGAGAEAGAAAKLTVALVDAVTGRLLFSQAHEVGGGGGAAQRPSSRHGNLHPPRPLASTCHAPPPCLVPQGATGPVHAVLTENMAAYHFWCAEQHRWQVGAVELFDASPTALRVSDLAFGEAHTTASSWDGAPVEAGATTLLTRLAVEGLGVTRSARGNTAKQIIMLTPAGARSRRVPVQGALRSAGPVGAGAGAGAAAVALAAGRAAHMQAHTPCPSPRPRVPARPPVPGPAAPPHPGRRQAHARAGGGGAAALPARAAAAGAAVRHAAPPGGGSHWQCVDRGR